MLRNYFININGVLAVIFGLVAIFFPGITLKVLGIYFAFTILIGGIALIASAIKLKKRKNKNWYYLLPEAVLGLILGNLIIWWPEMVATVFVTIIGIWALIIGAVLTFFALKNRVEKLIKTVTLLVGILSVIAGGIIIYNPFESTRVVTILIGIYAFIYGLFTIINSSKKYR